MTRTMGDATHANVSSLPAGLDLVAGYVTGSPDILWTAADWARFPGIPHVTIDQAFTGSPDLTAVVRDVEPGAWTPAAAVDRNGWTPERPTIYCDRNDLPTVLSLGWQGDLWLAIPGWAIGDPLPATPGCVVVAVQNQLNVNNAYDLSTVLDPDWPATPPPAAEENPVLTVVYPASAEVPAGQPWPGEFLTDGKTLAHIPADATAPGLYALLTANLPRFEITWSQYVNLGGK